jgi:hypothetical protein
VYFGVIRPYIQVAIAPRNIGTDGQTDRQTDKATYGFFFSKKKFITRNQSKPKI